MRHPTHQATGRLAGGSDWDTEDETGRDAVAGAADKCSGARAAALGTRRDDTTYSRAHHCGWQDVGGFEKHGDDCDEPLDTPRDLVENAALCRGGSLVENAALCRGGRWVGGIRFAGCCGWYHCMHIPRSLLRQPSERMHWERLRRRQSAARDTLHHD